VKKVVSKPLWRKIMAVVEAMISSSSTTNTRRRPHAWDIMFLLGAERKSSCWRAASRLYQMLVEIDVIIRNAIRQKVVNLGQNPGIACVLLMD
jgi:hypothetical protein